MEISKFKSGNWKKQFQYSSFSPSAINTDWTVDTGMLNKLLSEADIRLGELNAYSTLVPDVDFFIRMHVRKEATTSSLIEGTQTSLEESLRKKEYIEPERKSDWQEVNNYVTAMNHSIKSLDSLPLSSRLLKTAHSTLMKNARGEHKQPGEFRISQNWIGGATIKDAAFVPVHFEEIGPLMSDLEKFIHNENITTPNLVKAGILHYQFETIHPFLDGNGRIGRMLITLYLVSKGILLKPTLYLSAFFEKNRALYYDNLMRVRNQNDLTQWLKFFLEGVKQTAENSIQTFKNIISLRDRLERKTIPTLGKKTQTAQNLLHFLYGNPVVDSQDIAKELDINISTAHRLIEDFTRLKILKELTGFRRNRLFIFREYINLFE